MVVCAAVVVAGTEAPMRGSPLAATPTVVSAKAGGDEGTTRRGRGGSLRLPVPVAGASGPGAGMSSPVTPAMPEGVERRRWSLEKRPETVADDDPEVLATGTGTVHTLQRAGGDRRVGWPASSSKEGGSGRWGRSGDVNDAAVYSKGAPWRRPSVEEAAPEGQGWAREEVGKEGTPLCWRWGGG